MLRIVLGGALAGLALLATAPLWSPPSPATAAESDDLQVPPNFDRASAERGQVTLAAQCGFCHGTNGRGGAGGPNLISSPLVQENPDGQALAAFLQIGRPERGMPAFPGIPADQVHDLNTFLQSQVQFTANRRLLTIGDVLVGDPARGRAYFAANCASCHSATDDLAGVGGRYEPPTLQDRIVMPRAVPGFGPQAAPPAPPYTEKNAIKATVATPQGPVTGNVVVVSDFAVTIYDPATARMRSWTREDGAPEVRLTNPLQGHIDLLRKWKDADLHDVTAYLASLK